MSYSTQLLYVCLSGRHYLLNHLPRPQYVLLKAWNPWTIPYHLHRTWEGVGSVTSKLFLLFLGANGFFCFVFLLIVLGSLGPEVPDLLEQGGEAARCPYCPPTCCPASSPMSMKLTTRGTAPAWPWRSTACSLPNLEAGLWFSWRPKQCKTSQRNYLGHLGAGEISPGHHKSAPFLFC